MPTAKKTAAKKTAAKKTAAKKTTTRSRKADADELIPGTFLKAADFADYDPDVVRRVFDAEAAGQLSVLGDVPSDERPEALGEALAARVKANLAATGGKPVQSVGGTDPDVLRLEAPHRKLRAVSSDPSPADE